MLFGSSDGLWEMVDGSLQRLSTDVTGGSAQIVTVALSEDLQHIYFRTNRPMVAGDTDEIIDTYAASLPARPSGPPARPASPCPHIVGGAGAGLRLTNARVRPRRFHRGGCACRRVRHSARTGARIRFRLSDRARVTLVFARRVARPGRRARWKRAGQIRVRARKGINRVGSRAG